MARQPNFIHFVYPRVILRRKKCISVKSLIRSSRLKVEISRSWLVLMIFSFIYLKVFKSFTNHFGRHNINRNPIWFRPIKRFQMITINYIRNRVSTKSFGIPFCRLIYSGSNSYTWIRSSNLVCKVLSWNCLFLFIELYECSFISVWCRIIYSRKTTR